VSITNRINFDQIDYSTSAKPAALFVFATLAFQLAVLYQSHEIEILIKHLESGSYFRLMAVLAISAASILFVYFFCSGGVPLLLASPHNVSDDLCRFDFG
jgi:hypothetical protein